MAVVTLKFASLGRISCTPRSVGGFRAAEAEPCSSTGLTGGNFMPQDLIRVLHVLPHVAGGGATLQAMVIAENLDRNRFQGKLVVGSEDYGEGNLLQEMLDIGLEVIVLPHLRRAPSVPGDARAVLELTRVIQRERPHIIHTHGSKPKMLLPLATALSQPSVDPAPRLVAHLWGWEWQAVSDLPRRALCTAASILTAGRYDRFVACSETVRRQGLARGIGSPEQYRVVLPSVDLRRFSPNGKSKADARSEFGIAPGTPVVGSVMRLAEQKAPEILLQAAALLAPLAPDLRWLLIGGGPLEARVRRMIAELDLHGRVLMTGPRRDIPQLLQACDLFALSSSWEPFGIVCVEAAAMHIPVVCTAVDGTPEAVVHDQTGVLVRPHSPVALAAAIARLFSDSDLARRMGEAGRRHAQSFDPERFVRSIEEIYEDLLEDEFPPAR